MIRVVVTDDEAKVCQLICGLVDWPALDMEVVGVAHNGLEALEMVRTLRPDLMITDIRMPGCDGLELIGQAKRLCENLEFIIISGYRHFEYAQSAIKYGVCDYLLKPIKKAELESTLRKMGDRYRRRTEQLTQEERLKLRLQSDRDKLRAGLFSALLAGRAAWSEMTAERANQDYHFRFGPGVYQVFIVKMDCPYELLYQESFKILSERIGRALRGALTEECHDMELCFERSRAYGVLNYEGDGKQVRRQLRAGLDELLTQTGVFESVRLTIGLGAPVVSLPELERSLASAERAVSQRLLEGSGAVISVYPEPEENAVIDRLLSEFRRSMDTALEVLNRETAAVALQRLGMGALEGLLVGHDLLLLAQNAYRLYLTALIGRGLSAENPDEAHQVFAAQADLCGSGQELFALLADTVLHSVDAIMNDRRQAEKKPIRAAKQYIQENYMRPLTLEEVADQVGFNASYFSTLFKKESGQNFQEYLSEVRMNRAKELLKETNRNVAAICSDVGYSDLKHFTQSFKKFTGLKPNEFRKLYS